MLRASHVAIQCNKFEIVDLGFNTAYQLFIEGTSTKKLTLADCKNLTITMDDTIYSGELIALTHTFIHENNIKLCIQLACPLFKLQHSFSKNVFIDSTVETILKAILAQHAIRAEFNFDTPTALIPYTAQNAISDYDYLLQLCSAQQIVFYSRHEQSSTKLYFTQRKYHSMEHTLLFNPQNGAVAPTKPVINQLKYCAQWLHLTVSHLSLQVADLITIQNHPRIASKDKFRVLHIDAVVDHAGSSQSIKAIPVASNLNTSPNAQQNQALQIGVICDYHADSYLVKHFFAQQTEAFKAQASEPILGFTFPVGTKVILGYLNDATDIPIIIGALPDPLQPSVVAQQNLTDVRLSTRYGSTINFEDLACAQTIKLHTTNPLHSLLLEKQQTQERIVGNSLGCIQFTNSNHMHAKAGGNLQVSSNKQTFECSNAFTIMSKEVLQTYSNNLEYSTGYHWKAYTANGNFIAFAQQQLTFAGQSICLEAEQLNFAARIYTVNSQLPIMVQSNRINLSCGLSKLTIGFEAVNFQAPQITLCAPQIVKIA